MFLHCILQAGDKLTISELMEQQRARVRSSVPAERLAAALLIPNLLRERLRSLPDCEIGELLEHEVCSNLSVLAPELTVTMEAADRLCRREVGTFIALRSGRAALRDEGEHILHAESALYWGRIPHLLIPFQRNRFASNTFMVRCAAEARDCLCQAGFRESPHSPSLLIDRETNRTIRLLEEAH